MKVYGAYGDCLRERKTPILNGFNNIVETGAFAQVEQMLHFPHCLIFISFCFIGVRQR